MHGSNFNQFYFVVENTSYIYGCCVSCADMLECCEIGYAQEACPKLDHDVLSFDKILLLLLLVYV